ncbi:MAG: hypothetical protein JO022_12390, partial [Acidobacteriaceae bacterium]|nr:hypothetical protein [Acidobacteriaceae bacterium]
IATLRPELLDVVGVHEAVRSFVCPIDELDSGELLLATADPIDGAAWEQLEKKLARRIRPCLAKRSSLALAIRVGYDLDASSLGEPVYSDAYRRLGDLLLQDRSITPNRLSQAISGFVPGRGMRFGEFLVEHGYIQSSDLQRVLQRQRLSIAATERICAQAGGN